MFEVVLGEKRTCLLACQLFSIMFRNLRVTFCSFRASALMIMSALSPWMFAACSPCPYGFHLQTCPALFINAVTPPLFKGLVRVWNSYMKVHQAWASTHTHLWSTPNQRVFLPGLTPLPSPGSSAALKLSCSWLGTLSSLPPSPLAPAKGNNEGAVSQLRQRWVHWVHK